MVDLSLGRLQWYFMKKHQGKMGRIQNRDFETEAGQLGLFPSLPLSQLGQVYSACYSITKGDVHVLICQNVYVII